jgi:hypothetical protein
MGLQAGVELSCLAQYTVCAYAVLWTAPLPASSRQTQAALLLSQHTLHWYTLWRLAS